jgi:hypothetical protein
LLIELFNGEFAGALFCVGHVFIFCLF